MIAIKQDKENTIVFTPRKGFVKATKPQSCKLEYAHVCPSCGNVIQALFHTDQKIDLWAYEETNVMSIDKEGKKPIERTKVSPDSEDATGKTHYNVFYDAKTNSQKIVLKNHVLRFESIDLKNAEENAEWEVGGKVCEFAGLFSLREDLLIRDYVLFSRINESRVWDYPASKMKDVRFTDRYKVNGFAIPTIGNAPSVILIRYNIVNRGWEHAVAEFLGHLKTVA